MSSLAMVELTDRAWRGRGAVFLRAFGLRTRGYDDLSVPFGELITREDLLRISWIED